MPVSFFIFTATVCRSVCSAGHDLSIKTVTGSHKAVLFSRDNKTL